MNRRHLLAALLGLAAAASVSQVEAAPLQTAVNAVAPDDALLTPLRRGGRGRGRGGGRGRRVGWYRGR
ncbi:MAG: hypothetical protein ACRCXM_14180, partial [Beijerinckiaceae bacterium]